MFPDHDHDAFFLTHGRHDLCSSMHILFPFHDLHELCYETISSYVYDGLFRIITSSGCTLS